MSVRRLIISDLHFGSGDDLLARPAALERIGPELAWADELVINEVVVVVARDVVHPVHPAGVRTTDRPTLTATWTH